MEDVIQNCRTQDGSTLLVQDISSDVDRPYYSVKIVEDSGRYSEVRLDDSELRSFCLRTLTALDRNYIGRFDKSFDDAMFSISKSEHRGLDVEEEVKNKYVTEPRVITCNCSVPFNSKNCKNK